MKEFIVIVLLLTVVVISGCVSEYYDSYKHVEEFNELNKCYSDQDCVIGQEDVGPDLTSPEVECVTKGVTDRFDNWFESKNQLNIERYFCVCDISSNACITRYNITSCAQENYGNPLYCKGLFEGDEVPSCDCNKCSCESSNDGMLRPSCTEKVCIDKSECEALEGFWVDSNNSWVIIDEPYCNLPFSDHGKECTDSSQCEGNCEPPQEYLAREPGEDGWNVWVTPYRENVTGNCSKFSTGCLSYQIINGTLDLESQSICVVN